MYPLIMHVGSLSKQFSFWKDTIKANNLVLNVFNILYLDDGWGIGSNFNICKAFPDRVRQDLESVGFSINKEKSVWGPSRRLTWLGFIWDLNTFSL